MSEIQAVYETGAVADSIDWQWEAAAGEWLANLKAGRTRRAFLSG